MASNLDTLNIGSIRLRNEYPVAEVQRERRTDPENHPAAAAAARARIAALPDTQGLVLHPGTVPATPTADLVTDRATLARQLEHTQIVARPNIPFALQPIITAAGIFVLVLLLFKSPIIVSQVQYALSKPSATPTTSTTPAAGIIPAESTITIPKINVHAPVVYEPSVQEAAVQKALENGVVHYGNTAFPGQNGNVAIFGHSSNDWWEPGNFKFVFVLLDKLSPGDRLTLDYQSQRYTYEVTGSTIVDPTNVGVLSPTATPTLTIITCTPPGTSLRRLVVTAKQVDPSPSSATSATPTATPAASALPSSAPSFFTQVKQAWSGITHGLSSLFGGDTSSTSPSSTSPTPAQLPAIK